MPTCTFKEIAMPHRSLHAKTLAHPRMHPRSDRQRVLRWATVTFMLLLAAVAASRS